MLGGTRKEEKNLILHGQGHVPQTEPCFAA